DDERENETERVRPSNGRRHALVQRVLGFELPKRDGKGDGDDSGSMSLGARTAKVSMVVDRDHYDELVLRTISDARTSVWIGTANVKEMMVEAPIGSVARARGRYLSILDTFDDLSKRGVEIRILHAGTPSRAFRSRLKSKNKIAKLTMRQCPRVHLKMIAVDGASLYLGSANFTGAGLGAKAEGRRNF